MKKIELSILKTIALGSLMAIATNGFASEAELKLPDLRGVAYNNLGGINGFQLMLIGIAVCIIGLIFGLVQYSKIKALPVHDTMRNVSNIIWETCKSYLIQQGKFLAILWALIGICMIYYFMFLQHMSLAKVIVILLASILGILGSYG
ncbi:MAG: sodium/proton-translocating pyrophosphatase, partial [Limisphaerales bacterium]